MLTYPAYVSRCSVATKLHKQSPPWLFFFADADFACNIHLLRQSSCRSYLVLFQYSEKSEVLSASAPETAERAPRIHLIAQCSC